LHAEESPKSSNGTLSEEQAKALLELRDHVPRQLNAQASLRVSDARSIEDFSVGFLDNLL
jgi:hypothetical protein